MEESTKTLQTGLKTTKKPSLKKKPSVLVKVDDFRERLNVYCSDMFTEEYKQLVSQMYHLEDNWNDLIGDDYTTAKMRKQQQGIWEFLTTERNYIRRMRVICEVFKQVFRIAQRESDLLEIAEEEIFGNINEILITSDNIWKDYFVQVINKTRQKRRPIKPSELLAAFHETDELYKSYVEFNLLQDECLQKIREYSDANNEFKKDDPRRNFKIYLEYCENLPQCERLKLVDLMTEPMQRMTRYPLLLKSIHEATENVQEKKQLQSMINKFEGFVFEINKKKREIYEKQKLNDCLNDFEYYNTWAAGNEDVMWVGVDFLRSNIIPNTAHSEPRCILKQEPMKIVEKKGKTDLAVEVLLFTDALVIARRRNSSKKLVIIKQLYFLDKLRFIKSEISNTSIVFLYLDEHGLLASSLMLELPEKSRDGWLSAVQKAKERYEKAISGRGSTLEFFQDENKGATDDHIEEKQEKRSQNNNSNNGTEIFRKISTASKISNDNRSRKSSTISNKGLIMQVDPIRETLNNLTIEQTDTFDDDHEESSGVNRKSASWLLTEEQRVHSIRALLREDLWGNLLKVKPVEHSESFHSETDSGISLNGDSFRSTQSNFSSNGSNFRKRSTESIDSATSDTEKHFISRKISSSSMGLPDISEHIYTEVNFMRREQTTHRKQRRSIRKDDFYIQMDENNNEESPTSNSISSANRVFGTLTRSTSQKKPEKPENPEKPIIPTRSFSVKDDKLARHFNNPSSEKNNDHITAEPFYDDVTVPLPRKNNTDKHIQCNILPERISISTQTLTQQSNYVNHEIIAEKYGNYLQD